MVIDNDRGFYNFDLNFNLQGQVDDYEQDRRRYWEGLGGWSAIEYDKAERFAKAVLKNSEQLMPIEEIDGDLSKLQCEINKVNKLTELDKRMMDIVDLDLPWDKKRELFVELAKDCPQDPQSEESPLKLVWERFIIDMSHEAIGKIEEGALRIFRLYKLVLQSTPIAPTQQFLGRLCHCFIWGFDQECVILCRAVIDTGFREFVSEDICEKHRQYHDNSKGEHYYTLANRIIASLQEGIIDKEIKQKAFTIKDRGDKAVHYQPGITKDVWGTICDTVAVLERITQGK